MQKSGNDCGHPRKSVKHRSAPVQCQFARNPDQSGTTRTGSPVGDIIRHSGNGRAAQRVGSEPENSRSSFSNFLSTHCSGKISEAVARTIRALFRSLRRVCVALLRRQRVCLDGVPCDAKKILLHLPAKFPVENLDLDFFVEIIYNCFSYK